jgi:hypothetical protein
MPVSTFLLTVNTNQTSDVVPAEVLDEVMETIHANITAFVDYKDKSKASAKYIDDIELLGSIVEVGGSQHRVHNHSVIQFHHRTRIQLRKDKLSKVVREMLNLPGVHVDPQYVPEADIPTTLKYLGKTLRARK